MIKHTNLLLSNVDHSVTGCGKFNRWVKSSTWIIQSRWARPIQVPQMYENVISSANIGITSKSERKRIDWILISLWVYTPRRTAGHIGENTLLAASFATGGKILICHSLVVQMTNITITLVNVRNGCLLFDLHFSLEHDSPMSSS